MTIQEELAKPEYAGLTDAEVAEAVNSLTVTHYEDISPATFLRWCAGERLIKLKDAADNVAYPAALRGLCQALLLMFSVPGASINCSIPEHAAGAAGLVAAGIFTAEEVEALIAPSRKTVRKYEFVHAGDVARLKA